MKCRGGEHVGQSRGRLKAELGSQQIPEEFVVAQCLHYIVLSQMDGDDRAVRAFAQGLDPRTFYGRFERVDVASLGGKPLGECLESVQAKLTQPLPLEDHPVVVPAGQKLSPVARRTVQ